MKNFSFILSVLLIGLLLFGCTSKETPAPQAPEIPPSVISPQNTTPALPLLIQLDSGQLKGFTEDGINTYLGIPYAAPPTGELRWKPPKPVESWTGARNATEFAYPCTQTLADVKLQHETKNATSEDCLYLNVWTPAVSRAEKLPVMVWIHGGAFVTGSSSMTEYYGKGLAGKGVVVVSLNYRLGPFGFLVHPELATESPHNVSGNYGLLDQVAALRWVKSNIAAFGGDPETVTIFGESAGAMSVSSHLASPLSKGLFSKAIMESGTIFSLPYVLTNGNDSLESALDVAQAYADELGCTGAKQIGCLRGKSAEELQDATHSQVLFAPVFDGWFFPEDPHVLFAEGKQAEVPVLIGFNADEGSLFTNTSDASMAYREGAFIGPELLVADAMSEHVYFYEFAHAPPTPYGRRFGAYHSSEISYVFGTLNASAGYMPEDFALSERMMAYWVNFAKTGSPNAEGLPNWPLYDKQARKYLVLDLNITDAEGLNEAD